jgi:hypothetical protein
MDRIRHWHCRQLSRTRRDQQIRRPQFSAPQSRAMEVMSTGYKLKISDQLITAKFHEDNFCRTYQTIKKSILDLRNAVIPD